MGGAVAAVLFDLDETLIVEEAAVSGALRATAARATWHGVEADDLADTVRRRARELWRASPTWAWCQRIGISSWEGLCGEFEGDDPDVAALRAFAPGYRVQAWADALEEHGVRDEDLAQTLAKAYVAEHGPRRAAYPESASVLEALRPHHRLAVVTNGASDLQRKKLRDTGLERWFDVVTVSGDEGVGKPDRRVFERTLDRLGARPEESVMVGDNLERDVAGAQGAGLRAVWIDRLGRPPHPDVKPDARIRSLLELAPFLARGVSPS